MPGQPERGWWREAEWAELETDMFLGGTEFRERGTPGAWSLSEAYCPGLDIVERLRAVTVEHRAVAVFDVPHEESVVAWYLFGGISKSAGDTLEVVALERVWS